MKRFIVLSLSLFLLLVFIPGCVTVQIPASPATTPSGTSLGIGTFSSNPSTINPGGTSNLVWEVTGANTVSIDNGIGLVSAVGSRAISPATSTVYTISATNSSGTVTRSAVTTVNPAPPTPVSFMITKVVASVEPLTYTGTCPKTFTLTAAITANGPGTAIYRWEREDLRYSGVQSITFDTAGTQTVLMQWEFSETTAGWIRVHVLTGDVTSSPVNYTLTCKGD